MPKFYFLSELVKGLRCGQVWEFHISFFFLMIYEIYVCFIHMLWIAPCLHFFFLSQEFSKDPVSNWKSKDVAIYLVTSLAAKAQTQKVSNCKACLYFPLFTSKGLCGF